MPRIEVTTVPARQGSGYPKPFDIPCSARTRRRLGEAGGLRDFGVNVKAWRAYWEDEAKKTEREGNTTDLR